MAYFHTHFPVASSSPFEYDNTALNHVDEAYAIHSTYRFEFSEKNQIIRFDCDDHADKS